MAYNQTTTQHNNINQNTEQNQKEDQTLHLNPSKSRARNPKHTIL